MIRFLTSLKLAIVCLALLSILVIWGTFYQVDFGVYAAQKRFFDSWFFLISGIIPFPGVKSILAVLCINLLSSGIRIFSLKPQKAGILLIHLGTVVLIIGSAFSSFLVNESVLSMYEGEKANISVKHGTWEVAFYKQIGSNIKSIKSCSITDLKNGDTISLSEIGVTATIKDIYQNCLAFGSSPHAIDSIKPKALSHKREENLPGMNLVIDKKDGAESLKFDVALYAGAGAPTMYAIDSDTVLMLLQPANVKLPVVVELLNFSKEDHPGTSNAKSYQSRVRIANDKVDREVVISMNRPLRYLNFTFYQTSFKQENGRSASTLSVVENPVRFMPYLAGIIMITGLFLHFIIKFVKSVNTTVKK